MTKLEEIRAMDGEIKDAIHNDDLLEQSRVALKWCALVNQARIDEAMEQQERMMRRMMTQVMEAGR